MTKRKMMNTNHKKEKDLSRINNLSDLQREIAQLKLSIKMQEEELQGRLRSVPKESLKAATGAILPEVLQKVVLTKSLQPLFRLGKSLLFSGKKDKVSFKETALKLAKGIGVFAGAKALLKWVKIKK